MKLASLRGEGRDGQLLVVSRDLARAVPASEIAPTLQAALDDWPETAPRLEALSEKLNGETLPGETAFDPAAVAAPLPRAYHFVDGSAYLSHMELLRQARGGELPDSFRHDPPATIRWSIRPARMPIWGRRTRFPSSTRPGASISRPKSA
jgi:fumarylacetoacetate (FAA) hydrolase